MEASRRAQCEAAKRIFHPGSFAYYALIFRLITVLPCACAAIFSAIALYRTRSLHRNARVFLFCVALSFVLANTGLFLMGAFRLIVSWSLSEEEQCQVNVFSPYYYHYLRFPYVIGGLCLAFSTLFLAIERTVATVRFHSYENRTMPWLGAGLFAFEFLMCAIPVLISTPPRPFPYPTDELSDTRVTRITSFVLVSFNVVSLLIFIILCFINTRTVNNLKLKGTELSARFQLKENIRTTQLMVPLMAVVAFMTLSASTIYSTVLPNISEDSILTDQLVEEIVKYADYAEYQLSIMPILTIVMVTTLQWFSPSIRKSMFSLICMGHLCQERSQVDSMTGEVARKVYFDNLYTQWKDSRMHLK